MVIVTSEFLERHSKAEHTGAPAYSQALFQRDVPTTATLLWIPTTIEVVYACLARSHFTRGIYSRKLFVKADVLVRSTESIEGRVNCHILIDCHTILVWGEDGGVVVGICHVDLDVGRVLVTDVSVFDVDSQVEDLAQKWIKIYRLKKNFNSDSIKPFLLASYYRFMNIRTIIISTIMHLWKVTSYWKALINSCEFCSWCHKPWLWTVKKDNWNRLSLSQYTFPTYLNIQCTSFS